VEQLLAVESFLQALYDGFIALAVVDDCVALAAVDELLDVILGTASDCDDWVDVGLDGELESV
jgi:hypothetical protein